MSMSATVASLKRSGVVTHEPFRASAKKILD